MAKQNPKSKSSNTVIPAAAVQPPVSTAPSFQLPSWSAYLIIFLFSCMLYSNTLQNRYAIDDTIVLTDNKFTKKGFGGIKDHFTHDMFEGFFGERGAKLVSGGRYRPLSMASLTVEYEIMRKIRHDKRDEITDKNVIMGDIDPYLAPALSHGINILLFALTGLVLYYLLTLVIPAKKGNPFYLSLPFIVTMLYAAHPMHTEAVANIKGRDEVMCMLFSLLSLLAAVKYVKTQNVVHVIWGTIIYFIALLSKENAITFFAIIPLTFYFFTKAKTKDYIITLGAYIAPVAIFLFLRHLYTHAGLKDESPEILNNPFVGEFSNFSIRYGTTVYTFLRYYWLMLIPHPLTHDYYFNQVPYLGFDSPWVWLSILLTAGSVVYAFMNLQKKSLPAYAILFFFSTFSVASNVFFTVGVLMNERFIYMSSLGFCILLAYLLVKSKDQFKLSPNAMLLVLIAILSLYSYKTYSRNFDWKDSFTLFRRDVKYSPNSAKIQTSVGGDLTKASDWNLSLMRDSGMIKTIFNDLSGGSKSNDELAAIQSLPDSTIRFMLLDSSISHLNEAIRIYPNHSNAWLLMGNAMYKRDKRNWQPVISVYEKAAATRVGGYYDAHFNLGIVYNENNQAEKAKENLLKACEEKADIVECRFLLAQVYAKLNQPDSVELWIKKGQEIKPVSAADYYTIGTNFGKVAHNLPMAIAYLNKAIEMNPTAELYLEDLGVAYGIAGQFDNAIETAQKLIKVNPKYPAGYLNLSISYRNKGNKQLAEEYQKKYEEVLAAQKATATK